MLTLYRGYRGEVADTSVRQRVDDWIDTRSRPGSRLRPLMLQVATELYAFHHDHTRALDTAIRAADAGLHDLLWLDRHPLLAPLRADAAWPAIRAQVAARVGPVRAALDA